MSWGQQGCPELQASLKQSKQIAAGFRFQLAVAGYVTGSQSNQEFSEAKSQMLQAYNPPFIAEVAMSASHAEDVEGCPDYDPSDDSTEE